MRMGLYYSGIIDWCFHPEPIFNDRDVRQCNCPTGEYADYAYHQVMELIDRYHPSVLWNDIGWPYAGEHMLPHLLAHYYNTCPEGVVNDRFNGLFYDYTTKEYHQGEMNRKGKWENVRGLGLSFGYNTQEDSRHILSSQALVRELVATASNGGNLLINVGPMADGTVPEACVEVMNEVGKYVTENAEAIYGTKNVGIYPYEIPSIEFTKRPHKLYVHVLAPRYRVELLNIGNQLKGAYVVSTGEKLPCRALKCCEGNSMIEVELPEKLQGAKNYCVCLELEEEEPIF